MICERVAGCRQRVIHDVSQKVVIRDNMAVLEPVIPTRGSRMLHCSRHGACVMRMFSELDMALELDRRSTAWR